MGHGQITGEGRFVLDTASFSAEYCKGEFAANASTKWLLDLVTPAPPLKEEEEEEEEEEAEGKAEEDSGDDDDDEPEEEYKDRGTLFSACLAIEVLARSGDVREAALLSEHLGLARVVAQRGLAPLAGPACACPTEAEAAALAVFEEDSFNLDTRAVREGKGWVLAGPPRRVPAGATALSFLVFAQGDACGRVLAFLVGAGEPGLSVAPVGGGSQAAVVALQGLRVGAAHSLTSAVLSGEEVALEVLSARRLGEAARMLGLAQRALDAATPHLLPHYPAPVRASRAAQVDIARVSAEVVAARALTFAAVRFKEALDVDADALDWDTNQYIAQAGMAELVARRAAAGAASGAAAWLQGLQGAGGAAAAAAGSSGDAAAAEEAAAAAEAARCVEQCRSLASEPGGEATREAASLQLAEHFRMAYF